MVSTPKTRVATPDDWERSDIAYGDDDRAWCALQYVREGFDKHFVWAIGQFYTPLFYPASGSNESAAAFWPGMGGSVGMLTPIIQAGVDYYSEGSLGTWGIWWQYFPSALHHSGDVMVYPFAPIEVWVWQCRYCDPGDEENWDFTLDYNGACACMAYTNVELQQVSEIHHAKTSINWLVQYHGESAETVMERVQGYPLSNWLFVTPMWFYAMDSSETWYNFDKDDFGVTNIDNEAEAKKSGTNLAEFERFPD
jgi:hypothetical protein